MIGPYNEDFIADFQRTLMLSPFHRWLRLKAIMVTREQIEIALPWREEFVANTAIEATHGGVLAALIDLTGLYAIRAAGGIVNATADLRVDYHRPATRGTVHARGTVVKLGRRISTADVRVTDGGHVLVASGRGAYLAQ